jgi:hypothetical protein
MRWAEIRRPVRLATGFAIGPGAATVAWLLAAGGALAASPTPSAAAGGDPRSSGQGPGLVGDPLLAILVVVAIGVASLLVTLAYVRATGGSRGTDGSGPGA